MNLNKVIRSIFRDWPIKIISLLLAVGIYLVVNYVVLDTRYVEIPLEVIIPPGYEVMSKVPTSVTLKIVGDERYIQLVDPSAINAKADFTFATKGGTLSVPVLLEAQESYIDLNFTLSTAPEIIRLYLATVDVGGRVVATWRIAGVGVDAVKIGRLSRERMSQHILNRLFHPSEMTELETIKEGCELEFLASRYAAKEALVKALGSGFRGIYPSEIGVLSDSEGAPHFVLSGEVKARCNLNEKRIHLSLTHEGELALAFVVVEEQCG